MSLEKERKEIDKIDSKILNLLVKRVEKATNIGREKRKKGKAVYVPAREREIIENLLKKNKGRFPEESLRAIYSEIISTSRALEEPMKVTYLGPKTTFTHMAAIKRFGSQPKLVAKGSIKEVFDSVEKGDAKYGVVPIENSTEGTVNHTLDMFLDSDLNIVAEIVMDIRHYLLSKYKLEKIKKIYSHPQAIAQCRDWIIKNIPKAEITEVSSTAKAAETASLYIDSAAIASELAAKEFGLNIIARNIEDNPRNVTRFLVIGRAEPKKTGKDKTSIMFSVKHEAGALFKALKAFHDNNINMTKIESRPTKRKMWEVVFFIDFEGFVEDGKVQKALKELGEKCLFVKILGCYPEEVSVSG